MTTQHFLEAWDIHNRINLYLLEAVPDAALTGISASKGRTVAEQFAHIHNVRLMWLKVASPDLLEGLDKIEKGEITKKDLAAALEASSARIRTMVQKAMDGDGKVKNFKPHAAAFFGYLISHESHHRGQIAMTMKQCGHPLDKRVLFGIWEWGVR